MRIFISFLKFFTTVIISILLFEGYFSLSEISLPSTVMDDTTFGRAFKPNARVHNKKEGSALLQVNLEGYLGPVYTKHKNNQTFRIVLIGDSFVEGIQVAEKYHFRSVMEKGLNSSNTEFKYEVLNFGRSGLDFRKMYIHYELLAKSYDPDVVMLFVNESDFRTADQNIGPRVIISGNDDIQFDYSFNDSKEFKQKIENQFIRDYAIYSLIQAVYATYRSSKTYAIVFDKLYSLIDNKDTTEVVTKSNFETDTYRKLNEKVLKKLELEQAHTKIIIIPIKELSQTYRELIQSFHIKIINLIEPYKKLQMKGINPFYWKATNMNGHWNQTAHNEIGKYLAKEI